MRRLSPEYVWRLSIVLAVGALTFGSSIAQDGVFPLPVQVAEASSPAPDLEAGIASYWSGDYPDTVAVLSTTCPSLSEDEAIECFKYLGFGQVALGDAEGAQRSFKELLRRDSGYSLDASEVSPKILAEFDLARKGFSEARFENAKQAYFDKKYQEASALFEEVLVIDAGHIPAREYRDMAQERLALVQKEAELASAPPPAPPVTPAPDPNRIYRMTSQIEPPVLSRQIRPSYPEAAMRAKREGTVILSLVVTRDGSVEQLKIIRGVSPDIDREAVRTVSQWRYEPAELNGTAVSVRTVVQLEFRLRN